MIARPLFEADELYVVSDLHLGGEPGFQIFASGAEFERLVAHLVERASSRRIALVINGDFVDFLAEPSAGPPSCFDPGTATARLDRIAADEAFAPVWSALRELLATPNCSLVINLGNHDLELALPWVREHLCNALARGGEARRARLRVETDAAGVLCRVGPATVLCVHGNEVDDYNSVDHGALARLARGLVQGQPFTQWTPNGGSRMVANVINAWKREHYHFVDLLKPEGMAVLDFLVALGAGLADKAGDALSVQGLAAIHGAKRAAGLLGAQGHEAPRAGTALADTSAWLAERPDGSEAGAGWRVKDREKTGEALLQEASVRLGQGIRPIDLIGTAAGTDEALLEGLFRTLVRSASGALRGAVRGEDEAGVLRQSLAFLARDDSFDPGTPDETFVRLDQRIGAAIDIVVAGHTHLERAIRRRAGEGMYYNSGTWARLLRITPDLLRPEKFEEKVYGPIKQKSLEALDRANLACQRRTVVVVRSQDGHAAAELAHWEGAGPEGRLQPVSGTTFTKA